MLPSSRRTIVLASTRGYTAGKALEICAGLNLIAVGIERDRFPADQLAAFEQTGKVIFSREIESNYPPEMQQALMSSLLPYAYQDGYDYSNDILYTNRLRLQMKAEVADDVGFAGRLAMYKPWGESTGVQVFNGQPNSINIDGTTATVPNSDILRVESALSGLTPPRAQAEGEGENGGGHEALLS